MSQVQKKSYKLVSVHGGHSGEFCMHAKDYLEDIILEYINQGFSFVGITEHAPPINDSFLYPDEKLAGLNSEWHSENFNNYFNKINELKQKYSDKIKICSGFETETTSGYEAHIKKLINTFKPDYIVGSVHHVDDICFDFSQKNYQEAINNSENIDDMYSKYFDLQYDMLKVLKPQIVGHFDLIRIYDPEYKTRIKKTEIKKRIIRNLKLIKKLGLILEYNLRAFEKGANEGYPSKPILKTALKLEIPVIPGDDSHSVDTVGKNIIKGIKILKKHGFDIKFKQIDAF